MSHIAKRISSASARVARGWRALFAPKLRSFSVENRAILALKISKFSATAAADARRTPTKRPNNHFMHDAQVTQVVLSSAVFFAPKSAGKLHDFRLKSQQFR